MLMRGLFIHYNAWKRSFRKEEANTITKCKMKIISRLISAILRGIGVVKQDCNVFPCSHIIHIYEVGHFVAGRNDFVESS